MKGCLGVEREAEKGTGLREGEVLAGKYRIEGALGSGGAGSPSRRPSISSFRPASGSGAPGSREVGTIAPQPYRSSARAPFSFSTDTGTGVLSSGAKTATRSSSKDHRSASTAS